MYDANGEEVKKKRRKKKSSKRSSRPRQYGEDEVRPLQPGYSLAGRPSCITLPHPPSHRFDAPKP